MKPLLTEDHRVRVGAQRREKTRLRLLQAAVGVFSEKGLEATVIDDVIAAAQVSRGTFYNHFGTTAELVLALSAAMSDEVMGVVDPAVLTLSDPVHRFATGTRLYMQVALRYPVWGRFITNVGTRVAGRGQLIDSYLTRDLSLAIAGKRVAVSSLPVARDIVLGSIFYGIETMLTETTLDDHAEQLVATFLRGMGVGAKEVQEIAFMPLPDVGPVQGPIFATLPAPRRPSRKPAPAPAPVLAPAPAPAPPPAKARRKAVTA